MQVEVNPCIYGHLQSSSRDQYTELEDAVIFGGGVHAKGTIHSLKRGPYSKQYERGNTEARFLQKCPSK